MRTFTVDSMQKVGVTAMVVGSDRGGRRLTGNLLQVKITRLLRTQRGSRAYLLALNPRDALILKHLKDTDAIFDIVLRAPTSTIQFDLTL